MALVFTGTLLILVSSAHYNVGFIPTLALPNMGRERLYGERLSKRDPHSPSSLWEGNAMIYIVSTRTGN